MSAFSYGIGIYLGQEVWYSVVQARYRRRKLKALQKQGSSSTTGHSTTFPVGPTNSKDDWDREFNEMSNAAVEPSKEQKQHGNTSTKSTLSTKELFGDGPPQQQPSKRPVAPPNARSVAAAATTTTTSVGNTGGGEDFELSAQAYSSSSEDED